MAVHESVETEKVFESVRDLEEAVLRVTREWAKALDETMPVDMPVMRAVVKAAFDFADVVFKAQLDFAHEVLQATEQVTSVRGTRRARHTHPTPRPTKKAA